ncbi:tail assembly protein [Glaesserella parasuis]|uniref:tail assembly protein n=2 Tax=Glaesserella parasuis TaxID=738 RepID=UPI001F2017DA|nr:tail assembly protein [Glaesserella parasuis]MDD2173414.1 tail assembly protein [Glaesserella parasuis]MDG6474298.1 tail assembly protein [Glaesserella parasuis]MDO9800157.1 tail assembly protein [Glaesserella parasuis]MDO9852153.1 tail assembly protein [Glaesserella parasuis]MDO9865194.1 tail assembly protein [Glaesserella parasuis]
MVRVKFYGDLKRFEPNEPIVLEVSSFKELMSGLLSQIQGLSQHLRKGYYKVRIGKRYLSEEQIKTNPTMTLADDCTVHFTPVVAGAGKSGVLSIVAGALLIGAAFMLGPMGFGMVQGMTAMMMGSMGASLLLGGAMQMLARPPDMNTKLSDSEKQQSTSFSNIRNLTPQGRPIPLLYGKMMTSLILISQGIDTFDDISQGT